MTFITELEKESGGTKGMETRAFVLSHSIQIENLVSEILSKLLDINMEKSYSFGNKSMALSMSSKVYLAIDVGAMNKDEREKFTTFMSIRNQFMHNSKAESFVECLSHLKGKDTYLERLYPEITESDKEVRFRKLFENLADELWRITHKMYIAVISKMLKEAPAKFLPFIERAHKAGLDAFEESLKHSDVDLDYIELGLDAYYSAYDSIIDELP
jgi:hypothetical protein